LVKNAQKTVQTRIEQKCDGDIQLLRDGSYYIVAIISAVLICIIAIFWHPSIVLRNC